MHPYLPQIVQGLAAIHKNGHYDVILTTELAPAEGGEAIMKQRVVWMTQPDGVCWKKRPLPVALSHNCMFRKPALEALDNVGVSWVDITQSMNDTSALVCSCADLGVRAEMEHSCCSGIAAIQHNGELPELPDYHVVMYFSPSVDKAIVNEFAGIARRVFSAKCSPV